MPPPTNLPITVLIQQLRSGDAVVRRRAQEDVFRAYSRALRQYAERELSERFVRRGVEPQAIADTALRTVLMDPDATIDDRNSLWGFLTMLVVRRACDARRHELRAVRDLRREEHGSPDDGGALLDSGRRPERQEPIRREYRMARDEPSTPPGPAADDADFFDAGVVDLMTLGARPEEGTIAIELFEKIHPKFRDIAILRLEGRSDAEIAQRLRLSRRSVDRGLKKIQEDLVAASAVATGSGRGA